MIALIVRLTGLSRVASTVALIVGVVALLGVAKCSYDRSIVRDYEDEVQAELNGKTNAADAAADEQRAADSDTIQNNQMERDYEIIQSPAGKPSAAATALGCERLRKAGRDTSGLPECN